MSEEILREQSEAVVTLLSKLLRRLFTLTVDDPAMELPGAQMRVCNILRDGPRTMSSLSAELVISHSAATQIADRLERAGMVERLQETDDRRCKRLALTQRGIEVMQARVERRILRTLKVLESISAEQRDAAVTALRVLLEAGIATAPELPDDSSVPEHLVN